MAINVFTHWFTNDSCGKEHLPEANVPPAAGTPKDESKPNADCDAEDEDLYELDDELGDLL